MAFLRNRDVNLLSLHYAFQALAQGSGGVFLLVYLLKSGLSVKETILALAATIFLRLVARRGVAPFAMRWGLRTTLMAGCLVMAAQYPLSAAIDGIGWGLVARCLATGVGEAFYWTAFHAYFASVGDSEHRGHQIGAREALAAGIGILAPLFGAWALMNLGAGAAFAAIGGIQALGIVPLLRAPSVDVVKDAPGMREAARLGGLIYLANGWFATSFVLVWQVALFLSLSGSLSAYGGTMAIAAIAGGAGGLMLGKLLDGGYGARATVIIFAGIALAVVFRASSLGVPELAVIANAVGAFAICFYVPAINTPVYNLAKASPCSLRFHVATEDNWDRGALAACATSVILLSLGAGLSSLILLALASCIAHALLLRRYYRTQSVPQA